MLIVYKIPLKKWRRRLELASEDESVLSSQVFFFSADDKDRLRRYSPLVALGKQNNRTDEKKAPVCSSQVRQDGLTVREVSAFPQSIS